MASMSSLELNPLVCYAGAGNQPGKFNTMKKLGNAGNQELFEAMQLQETLIGNLKRDEVRMLEQYRALNRELSRRAQLGDAGVAAETSATASAGEHGTTAGTVETAVARHRERVKEESIDHGEFGNWERNIIVACNFAYREGNLQGQAYFLYSTVALANFVVNRLHNRELRRRSLYVKISDCRLNTTNLSRRGNYLGRSRSGESIWDCPEAPRSRQQE